MSSHLQQNQYMKFQYNKASIHTTKLTQEWLCYSFTPSIPWPTWSPDLNHVENMEFNGSRGLQ